jgi:hypothetical protein
MQNSKNFQEDPRTPTPRGGKGRGGKSGRKKTGKKRGEGDEEVGREGLNERKGIKRGEKGGGKGRGIRTPPPDAPDTSTPLPLDIQQSE